MNKILRKYKKKMIKICEMFIEDWKNNSKFATKNLRKNLIRRNKLIKKYIVQQQQQQTENENNSLA